MTISGPYKLNASFRNINKVLHDLERTILGPLCKSVCPHCKAMCSVQRVPVQMSRKKFWELNRHKMYMHAHTRTHKCDLNSSNFRAPLCLRPWHGACCPTFPSDPIIYTGKSRISWKIPPQMKSIMGYTSVQKKLVGNSIPWFDRNVFLEKRNFLLEKKHGKMMSGNRLKASKRNY